MTIVSSLVQPLVHPLVTALMAAGGAGGAPKPAFDYLLLVGSSTTFEAFTESPVLGRQEQNVRLAFTSRGRDVPVINKAASGSKIADLDANINTYMTQLGGPTKKVAVLINIGSNDIGATAYESMLQAEKDAMLAGLNSIYNKVLAAGHTPIIATVHSRQSSQALYEEWAEKMYRPLIESLHPHWFSGGIATFDYCRLYFENKDVPNWFRDGVHPLEALVPMQQYTAQRLISKASLPALQEGKKVLFYFTSPSLPALRHGGLNVMQNATTRSLSEVYDSNGALITGASFAWAGADAGSNGVRPITGSWDIGLGHHEIQKSSLYALSKTITFTANFGAAYAGRSGMLRVTGNSNVAGRLTLITAGASSVVLSQSAAGVQVVEIPFTLDAAGAMTFTAAPKAPSTYANVSGVELVFN